MVRVRGLIVALVLGAMAVGCAQSQPAGRGPQSASRDTAPAPATQPAPRADAGAARPTGEHPPNIILITTDDQAPDTLHFDGNSYIRTPTLDRLAAEGVYFPRAYVVVPLCAPSRAALLTGRYPQETGVRTNAEARLPDGLPTFAQLVRSRGYRCGLVGKWHLGAPEARAGGFEDYWVTWAADEASRKTKYTRPVLYVNGELKEHRGPLTDVLTDYALQFIDESGEQPFLLWLSHPAPHEPRVADKRFFYDRASVRLPASMKDDLTGKPVRQRQSECHRSIDQYPKAILKREIAAYYSMIQGVDAAVGRLIRHLEQRGLAQRTLVIFTSDNGLLLGEHQMVAKNCPVLYEELVRVPLLFWQPGAVPAGVRRTELVSLMDLFATIVARAGAPNVQTPSRDLWPLIVGAGGAGRDALFVQYYGRGDETPGPPLIGVITPRHKLVAYAEGDDQEKELYDLLADPLELKNLAGATGYEETQRRLEGMLAEFAAAGGGPR